MLFAASEQSHRPQLYASVHELVLTMSSLRSSSLLGRDATVSVRYWRNKVEQRLSQGLNAAAYKQRAAMFPLKEKRMCFQQAFASFQDYGTKYSFRAASDGHYSNKESLAPVASLAPPLL